jgi:hypothetical protein
MVSRLVVLACLAAPSAGRAAPPARPGVVMEIGTGAAFARPSVLYLSGDRLRIQEPGEPGAEAPAMVFDAATRTMTRIEPDERRYVQFDADDLRRAVEQGRARAREAMAQARAVAGQLPPDERKKLEEMLARLDAPEKAARIPKFRFEKTGRTGSAAGFACEWYRQYEDGVSQGEACFASLRKLGLKLEDFKALEALSAVYVGLGDGGGERLDLGKILAQAPGFPIIGARTEDGRLQEDMRLVRLERRDLPASLFTVPPDYRRSPFSPGDGDDGPAPGSGPATPPATGTSVPQGAEAPAAGNPGATVR